jgi:hypothetical protein
MLEGWVERTGATGPVRCDYSLKPDSNIIVTDRIGVCHKNGTLKPCRKRTRVIISDFVHNNSTTIGDIQKPFTPHGNPA